MSNVRISELPAATLPLTGAELVPVVQSGVTKQTTAAAVGANAVNVKAYGAKGDGVTDDTAAIQAALNASDTVVFSEGTYYLGVHSSSNDHVFEIHNASKVLRAQGKVEFVLATSAGTGDCYPVVFDLYNCDGSRFDIFHFRDLGYDDNTGNRRGLKAYRLTSDAASGTWGFDCQIAGIVAKNCIAPLSFENGTSTDRVRGVTVGNIALENTYYGPLFQNNGDDFYCASIVANSVRRVYFAYGVKNHRVEIFDRNPKGSTGTVNISRSVGGLNTEGLRVRYTCREATVANQLYVLINHIDLLGGTIRDIDLDLTIDVSIAAVPIRFINYDGSGNQSSAASSNVVENVTIRGWFGSTSGSINTVASYATRGALDVQAKGTVAYGSGTKTAFLLFTDSGTWTPVLVDGDLNPSKGQTASVAIGWYQKIDRIVHFFGRLRMTSLGTLNTSAAAIVLGLPYTSANVSNQISPVLVGFGANLNLSAADPLAGYVSQNSNYMTIQKWSATTGTANVAISEISFDGEISFSGSYLI